MDPRTILLRGLDRDQRIKAGLLSSWFFVTVAALWLLKPIRVATLLAHLGASETPYVRLAGVVVIGSVVLLYSFFVNRFSRIQVVAWGNLIFAAVLLLFWLAMHLGGPTLLAQRPFIWAIYVMVEVYSVLIIGIFWTYTNDIVTQEESNRLYGLVGLGGILGGIAGGAFVDGMGAGMGPPDLVLIATGLVAVSAWLATVTEKVVHPPKRRVVKNPHRGLFAAWDGATEVKNSRYLLLIVAVMVAYEFTATLADFGVNVVFEHAYHDQLELAKMYGRLGWIASGAAIVGQLVLVPLFLPIKRVALLVPPLTMLAGALGVVVLPAVGTALVLAATDRGLNYSLQQSTKESLYVPLPDVQKYKAKAFIDMFVDRAAKAAAAMVLLLVIWLAGESVRVALAVSIASLLVWLGSARRLGKYWKAGPPAQ